MFSASAAAGFVADTANVTLDAPGFDAVKPWLPQLNLGSNTTNGIEALIKVEVGISSSSDRRGRSMLEADRRRLDESIPHDAHRGLRMLRSDCNDDLLEGFPPQGPPLNCTVDTAANEYFCARMGVIRLDLNKLQDLVEPILLELVNDEKTGSFDKIARPLQELDEPLPGISDLAGKTITILDIAELLIGPKSGADTVRK